MDKNFLKDLRDQLKATQKRYDRIKLLKSVYQNAPNDAAKQTIQVWLMVEEFPKETRGNRQFKRDKIDHLKKELVIAEAYHLIERNPSIFTAKYPDSLVSEKLCIELSVMFDISESSVKRILQNFSEKLVRVGYPAPFRLK